jgi:hypothetical protein
MFKVASTAVAFATTRREDAQATSGVFRFSYLVDHSQVSQARLLIANSSPIRCWYGSASSR